MSQGAGEARRFATEGDDEDLWIEGPVGKTNISRRKHWRKRSATVSTLNYEF
jgi:hypothetical protein